MSREKNIRFIELVTNGSLLTSRLPHMVDEYELDLSKLTLWITYHHTEISAERLVENAAYAQRRGANVVVNALLFPDTVEPIAHLHRLCAAHGLCTNVDLGQDFDDSHEAFSFVPLLQDAQVLNSTGLVDEKTAMLSVVAAVNPKGLNCSAGHDYIFVGRGGDVYPCLGYLRYLPGTKLGSALDPGFVPSLRQKSYSSCGVDMGCTCKEDFLHLELAQPGSSPVHKRSLGYWPPSVDGSIDRALMQRFTQVMPSGKLKNAAFWGRHLQARAGTSGSQTSS